MHMNDLTAGELRVNKWHVVIGGVLDDLIGWLVANHRFPRGLASSHHVATRGPPKIGRRSNPRPLSPKSKP